MVNKSFYIEVAGIRYENSDNTSRKKYLLQMTDKDELFLEREPNNAFDSCAVKVVYGKNKQIGYIPRRYSEIIFNYLVNKFDYKISGISITRKDIGYDLNCGFKLIFHIT